MSELRGERRSLHALREHIDCLLARGAVISSREPLRLQLHGRMLLVEHGMLIAEQGALDLIRMLATMDWDSGQRDRIIDMCLKQLDQAIEQLMPQAPRAQPTPERVE